MAKTAVISARIDPELKDNAEQIFEQLGLNISQAITFFQTNLAATRLAFCG